MLWHAIQGAGGAGGDTYSTFTVIYLGDTGYVTGSSTGFGLDAPQSDRQIVAIMSTNDERAQSYTCSVGGVSLTRVVYRNGASQAAPGTAIFLGSVPNGTTGDVSFSDPSNSQGVVGLYAVYRAETSASATAFQTGSGGSGSYTITSGGGVVFAGVGVRNRSGSIERRGVGGEHVTASGTVTVNYTNANSGAVSGDITERWNVKLGNTGSTDNPVSCAMALDSL